MKNTLIALVFCFGYWVASFSQSPNLEIHHIGAGDGDATLIIAIDSTTDYGVDGKVIWDTTIILIDGQRSGGGAEVWRYVRDTVNALSPNLKKIDIIITSHLHVDHYGGTPEIISSAKMSGWAVKRVYDRQKALYPTSGMSIVDSCYDSIAAPVPNAVTFQKYNDTLNKYNLYPPGVLDIRQNLLAAMVNIQMTCVVGNGACISSIDANKDTTFLPFKRSVDGDSIYYPKSENDLSYGFLIQFQGFHYLTSGDLGGKSGGNYIDGETPMTKGMINLLNNPDGYHMCANKVSHHGSSESTTPWFANANNFTVSVFPARLKSYGSSNHALPTEASITTLNNISDSLFYTFIPKHPDEQSSYWTKGDFDKYNDVVIELNSPPGYNNVTITIKQAAKTQDFVYTGSTSFQNIICTKNHTWN